MAFNINDLTAFFDNPAVSRFNRSRKHESDCNIGPMIPHNWDLLNFGNSAKGNTFHAMRLAPMLAPNWSDLQLQEHTAVVPLRVIMKNYEDTMNYATNEDGANLPSFTSRQYHSILFAMLNSGIPLEGSLLDHMGYPIYSDVFNVMFTPDFIARIHYRDASGYSRIRDVYEILNAPAWNDYYNELLSPNEESSLSFDYRNELFEFNPSTRSMLSLQAWVFSRHASITTQEFADFASGFFRLNDLSVAALATYGGFITVQNMIEQYQSYLFSVILGFYFGTDSHYLEFGTKKITALPLMAYMRFHYDWNVNGNFFDRDAMIENYVFDYVNHLNMVCLSINSGKSTDDLVRQLKEMVLPKNRLWDYDFFTSLLPTSAVDNAIEIPANSTVLDLAALTAFQKLVLKLSYSSRYRDVVWNVFKIAPSDARLQQSSIISRKYHNIGIGESLQTSATDSSSVQGNFVGRGYSSGRGDGFHIFCEEPCILLNLYSFVPKAVFADAVHPLIHIDDIFDLPIPDMDVLGNQPIYTDLLTGNMKDDDIVFGYGRQYQEWLSNYSTVHGSLKTTRKYWQLSRRFETVPALNDDFLRINDKSDFDEIFSVPDSPQADIKILTQYSVTRHVHRSVRIQI